MPEVVGHPLDAGLAGLAAAYDDGLDPVAVVDAVLDRIGASGDDAVWIDVEPAAVLRTEAERIAALARDGRPLWGVPFAVKDNIDVAGRTTTAGLPGLARRATATATAVARLQSAGAIYVGKTNLDQLATGLVGTRSPYGTPRNPIDPALVPGGSSSGSAVAVALGHVPLALGTDTAGSGRVPAAMCGVVGLKGAPGTRPVDGLVPASPTIDCVSTFAGTVADGLVAEGVLAGSPWPVASGKALTIAVAPGAGAEGCRPGAGGAPGGPRRPGALPRGGRPALRRSVAGRSDRGAERGPGRRAQRDGGRGRRRGGRRRAYAGTDVFRAIARLAARRAELARWWGEVDALVVPTVHVPADARRGGGRSDRGERPPGPQHHLRQPARPHRDRRARARQGTRAGPPCWRHRTWRAPWPPRPPP
ncbi:MAG: amidase family protein [Acidimicrobiales bacterium]